MHVVIIGGDAAGMSAASKIKRNRPEFTVTVLEKTDDVSYSACGMPYNIADKDRPIEDLVVRQAAVFREKQDINLLTGHEVLDVRAGEKKVTGTTPDGSTFAYAYDHLVIATGGSPIVPDLPGMDLPGVMALKSLDDGRRIKAYIREKQVKRVVIIGMGYIGLEMAEALTARAIAVEMVKPNPVFLPWLAPELSEAVEKEVSGHGVTLHAGHEIRRIEREEQGLKVVCGDMELATDMVLLAIGITPNSGIAAQAGVKLGAGQAIGVDQFSKTSDSHIYAAGDCADALHVVTGKQTWIPLALRANRAGWAVADTICGNPTTVPPIAGTAVFKVFDLQVARTGIGAAEAKKAGFEPVQVTIRSRSRAHAHPGSSTIWVHMVGDRQTGRLLGVQMIGRESVAHRINGAAVALHAAMGVREFSETDLAYAPPFGPVWDPMLTAANQLLKKMI